MVEVKLLNYTFRFHSLNWRQEMAVKPQKGQIPERVHLARALSEISGLKISGFEDAYRVLLAVPLPIVTRVYQMYRSQLPSARVFRTVNLYRAPEANQITSLIQIEEDKAEQMAEAAQQRLVSQFGKQELADAEAVDLEILRKSGLRGAVKVEENSNE